MSANIYKYTKFEWQGHPGGYPEEGEARGNISHEQASSWDYLMGGEAQGCRVMGDSHDHDTLEPPDQWGFHPITRRRALPKRDRPWERAGR